MRSQVFIAMFPSRGRRSGGISKMKSEGAPGTKREASQPTSSIEPPTATMISAKPAREMKLARPRITPSCAEHGTPRASSSVTMKRSLRLSRMRAVIVAIVSQPRPSTIGRIALPLRPISRKRRLDMIASRGR